MAKSLKTGTELELSHSGRHGKEQQTSELAPILTLPPELLLMIYALLPLRKDQGHFVRTCKFTVACLNGEFWRPLTQPGDASDAIFEESLRMPYPESEFRTTLILNKKITTPTHLLSLSLHGKYNKIVEDIEHQRSTVDDYGPESRPAKIVRELDHLKLSPYYRSLPYRGRLGYCDLLSAYMRINGSRADFNIIALLVERGADLNTIFKFGTDPDDQRSFLCMLVQCVRFKDSERAKFDNLMRLLFEGPRREELQVTETECGELLSSAILHSMEQTAKYLLQRGADIYAGDVSAYDMARIAPIPSELKKIIKTKHKELNKQKRLAAKDTKARKGSRRRGTGENSNTTRH